MRFLCRTCDRPRFSVLHRKIEQIGLSWLYCSLWDCGRSVTLLLGTFFFFLAVSRLIPCNGGNNTMWTAPNLCAWRCHDWWGKEGSSSWISASNPFVLQPLPGFLSGQGCLAAAYSPTPHWEHVHPAKAEDGSYICQDEQAFSHHLLKVHGHGIVVQQLLASNGF